MEQPRLAHEALADLDGWTLEAMAEDARADGMEMALQGMKQMERWKIEEQIAQTKERTPDGQVADSGKVGSQIAHQGLHGGPGPGHQTR